MLKPLLVLPKARRPFRAEQGYILLTLLLFVAMISIALAVEMPILKQQIQRDQEEEMVHRGAQYARAIRRYYRKFGRYPVSIDVLESQNNLRFLRKRYKDPVNGEDFRILHITDVQLSFGRRSLGRPINSAFNPGDSGTASDPNAAHGTTTPASAFNPGDTGTASDPNAAHGTTTPASDTPAPATPGTGAGDSTSNSPFTSASGQPTGPTLGAVPIVGVASTSTKESLRVYNQKNHYNEWQFIYDPTVDRGLLITGPYEPVLQTLFPGQGGIGVGTGSSQGSSQNTPGTVPPNNPSPLPH